jgi:SsrA-binding protein
MTEIKASIEIKNRKAHHEYELLKTFEAGIRLKGTEIKAIREGRANLKESFCHFDGHELWVHKMHIGPYSKAEPDAHENKRKRKLLLRKKELKRIKKRVQQRGHTPIPVRLHIGKSGYAKLEIALAKGKKKYDKRESIKRKEMKRKVERELKEWQQS